MSRESLVPSKAPSSYNPSRDKTSILKNWRRETLMKYRTLEASRDFTHPWGKELSTQWRTITMLSS